MEHENQNPLPPVTPDLNLPPYPPPGPGPYVPYTPPVIPVTPPFPTGSRELLFALMSLVLGMVVCNFTAFGGFNLGFAIGMNLCISATSAYLLAQGHRVTPYSGLLLAISLVIGAGFAVSDDGFVKFVMVCFLFVSANLGLTLLAGQQRHDPGSVVSLLDSFYTGFVHSFGRFVPAFSGLKQTVTSRSEGWRKGSAIVKGLLIALPVVVIMVVLLVRADAAFEGLVDLLPEFDLGEVYVTLLLGAGAFCVLYVQGVSLQHSQKKQPPASRRKGVNPLTVNTVLIAVCLVYTVYLLSQLAYFVGGFAGILPENYTMAQYARRGFFEMAWLCAINLGLIGLSVGLVAKEPVPPLLTRLLCLFISVITVFFVVTASAKMFLYIDSYGLTRLRVLTQVIMLWLCLTTVLVAVWLFQPKLPYMKTVIAAGLIIGTLVLWGDVDRLVARHNVDRYLSGELSHMDIQYLGTLNDSAVPYLAKLTRLAPEADVRQTARELLDSWYSPAPEDFRGWNRATGNAQPYLPNAPENIP